jgi:predicted deacylase
LKSETLSFPGDTPGQAFELTVIRFVGIDESAPGAYLQASLHGGELPGGVALHHLVPLLQAAETSGAIAGNITIVPQANPLASAQWLGGQHTGRFDLKGRTNFNRDFPLLDGFDACALAKPDDAVALDKRIKASLLGLALPHEIILDLHCDDAGESYFYAHEDSWPGMSDLARHLGSAAVILMDTTVSAAFDEACLHPVLQRPPAERDWSRRAVATVEFRGEADVNDHHGRSDAEGLFGFLTARGVITGTAAPKPDFAGPATPTSHVEILKAPVGGMVLFDVETGDRVEQGQRVARIVPAIGFPEQDVQLLAPQAGLLLTRKSHPYLGRGDDVCKILGSQPAAPRPPGALEA